MATTTTPTWTDNVSVIAAATLARGSTARGTLDLRTKRGAYLFLAIGRGGTAALTNGVSVLVRRTLNNDGAIHPAPVAEFLSQTAAATATTVNSNSNSGQAALNVASSSGFAAGQIICVEGASQARQEFHRVSKVAAGIITLDTNLKTTHTSAQADTVRNVADVWLIWIDGGATFEGIFDYGDDTAGDSVSIVAEAQTYDSDGTV